MGSFYANMHIRTRDQQQVMRAWQDYWDGHDESSWMLVSPAYGAWVSLFDWRCDQLDTDALTDLTAHVSRVTDCVVLAFQVRDSAVADYWLFNHGNEVDHYTSNAEYFAAYAEQPETTPEEGVYSGFGPDEKPAFSTEEDISDGGNVSLLHSLTGAAASEMELEAILRTPAFIADDILTALASAIGINDAWASLGYHYLATEGDAVPGIDKFIRLPANEPINPQRSPERE